MKTIFLSILKLIIAILLFTKNVQSRDLIKDLEKTKNHSTLIDIIQNNPLFLPLINNSIRATIFAPTDDAFEKMPTRFKNDIASNNTKVTTKLILSHIFSGDTLSEKKNEDGIALSLDGSIYYTYGFLDHAAFYWKKAYYINPNGPDMHEIKEFISKY